MSEPTSRRLTLPSLVLFCAAGLGLLLEAGEVYTLSPERVRALQVTGVGALVLLLVATWRTPYQWVSSTYFAEGFPYAIVNNLAEVLFTELGASLRIIGLTSIFHLPWNLKFLWGPFVDEFETKRRWLLATEVILTALLVVLALMSTSSLLLVAISGVFLLAAFVSATHDAAVDGYYMEGLDEAGQAKFVGYRAAAYRASTVLVIGVFLVLAGQVGWVATFGIAAVLMLGLTTLHSVTLPAVEPRGKDARLLLRMLLRPRIITVGLVIVVAAVAWRGSDIDLGIGETLAEIPILGRIKFPVGGWIGLSFVVVLGVVLARLDRVKARLRRRDSNYARAFVHFLDQPKIVATLAFVLLFRTGESFLMKMRHAFLSREVELSLEQIGLLNGILGWVFAIAGTILGGHLINKYGLRRCIWPFVLLQNVPNLLYAWVAGTPDPSATSVPVMGLVISFEHFGAGLGTAVFMIYTLRCCDPRHKAANMAIVTSIMSLGFTLAGAISGDLAQSLGFSTYFWVTFLVTIPSMLLLFVVPHLDGREQAEPVSDDDKERSSPPT